MSKSNLLRARAHVENVRTGIDAEGRRELAEGLGRVPADTYTLYVKTQGVHWNVVGPLFYSLHKLTEAQYAELTEATDKLAERIRALGHPAPASFKQFVELTELEEETGVPSGEAMLRQLIADHETVARRLREVATTSDKANDDVTSDLLTRRLESHEQAVWMLRALPA